MGWGHGKIGRNEDKWGGWDKESIWGGRGGFREGLKEDFDNLTA